MSFTQNINLIHSEILRAQKKSNASAEKVRILAATKGRSPEEINEIIKNEHISLIGENRLQEAEVKFSRLKKCERHFIGNIQSRKIPKIVSNFDCIESVSGLFHAEKISTSAQKEEKEIDIFIEVSVTGEKQKSGVPLQNLDEFLGQASKYKNIKIRGLMTMARFGAQEKELRETFSALRKLRDNYQKIYPELQELSMGMSDDFKLAVEEGATIVRLGRVLFTG